jgi:hypothetical protein
MSAWVPPGGPVAPPPPAAAAPSTQENGTWGRIRAWYKEGKDMWEKADKKYHLKTRYEGLSRAVDGAGLVTAAAPFCASSEFVLPAVACVGLGAKGADDLSSGSIQAVTGEETPTYTQTLAQNTTKSLGGSDQLADAVGKGTETPEKMVDVKDKFEKAEKLGTWVKKMLKGSPKAPPKVKAPYFPPDDIQ